MRDISANSSPKAFIINNPNPWFDLILSGKKTVEGRLNRGIYQRLKVGQVIHFRDTTTKRMMQVIIKDIRKYGSFRSYIANEGCDQVAPHLKTVDEAVATYQKFYRAANPDIKHGALAIEVAEPRLIK